MKLLSMRLCEHDSNFSYFDGHELHYHKTERTYQEKHHAFNNLWQWRDEIKNVWNLNYNDIDEISIVIDPHYYNLPKDTFDYISIENYDLFPSSCNVVRLDHHYAHSLCGWMILEKSDIQIVIDGYGDNENSISVFKNDNVLYRAKIEEIGSIGMSMGITGFNLKIDNCHGQDIAGKLMGLQSYGKYDIEFAQKIKHLNIKNVREIFDPSLWNNHKQCLILAHHTRLDWIKTVHEEIGKKLVDFFRNYATENDVIFYSGGVAQNVLWNSELKKVFKNLHIPPHSADEGLSLGGIEFLRRKHNLPKFKFNKFPYCQSDEYAEPAPDSLIEDAAKLLAQGKIVAWYQENGEIGPRALGNRSILMDPRIKNGRDVINKLKRREPYRPFGASVLKECKDDIFEDLPENPYMLYVSKLKNHSYPAIEHVDGTCRAQTVDESNGTFYKLMKRFYELTGCPVLLNTSFNLAGKPIVGSKVDAIHYFQNTDLDCLVVGREMRTKNV